MKKILSSLAMVALCSTSALAQGYYLDFDPEMGTVLESREYTVRATLTETAKLDVPEAAGALVQPIGGYGFSQEGYEPFEAEMKGEEISIELKDGMWGIPFNEMYHIQLLVVLTDKDGTPLMDDVTDDFIMDMSAYMCPDTGAARFVRSYPNNDWNGVSFDQAYQYGVCKLFYTKKVAITGMLGTIQYYDEDGSPVYEDSVEITSYNAEWSEMDGLYVVSFTYADADLSAEDLSKIEITISGVSIGDQTIILDNSKVIPMERVLKNKYNLESDFIISDKPMDIYSIQGTLVKKDATNFSGLKPGLYLVDGKKLVVK